MDPILPRQITAIDRGAEYLGQTPSGGTIWHCVWSPPSSIEREMVYVYERGEVRAATEEDFNERIMP